MPTASVDVTTVRQRFNYEWAMTEPVDGLDTYWWWARSIRVDPNEVIADDDEGNLWSVSFTYDEPSDTVTFGQPVKVRETFIPVQTGDGAAAEAVVSRRRQTVLAAVLEKPVKDPKAASRPRPNEEVPTVALDIPALRSRLQHDLADTGASAVVSEMAAQGVTVTPPDLTTVKADLSDRAAVIAGTMAASLTETAAREAVRIAGSALAPEDVATGVAEHLGSLTDAFLTDQLGGAAMAGMNAGRFHTMLSLPDGTRYAGSALLDTNTCIPCADDDGREWTVLSEALQTYPVGGNKDCLGRWRCRCTLVAIAPDEVAPSVE